MKVKLVFREWLDKGSFLPVPFGEKRLELQGGQIHSGTVIEAELGLTDAQEAELRAVLRAGYAPAYYVHLEDKTEQISLL